MAEHWKEVVDDYIKKSPSLFEEYKLKEKEERKKLMNEYYKEQAAQTTATQNAQSNKPVTPQPQETPPRATLFDRLNRGWDGTPPGVYKYAYRNDSVVYPMHPGIKPGAPDTFRIIYKPGYVRPIH